MPFNIQVKKDQGYIQVEQFGDWAVSEGEEIRQQVFELVAREAILNIVLDVRGMTGDVSTMDLFKATVEHASYNTQIPKPRTAMIVRPDQKENAKFIEDVALNRGMQIKVFIDRNEALGWLSGL